MVGNTPPREDFRETTPAFLNAGLQVLEHLANFQITWGLRDHDTALGLIRDSLVGSLMGYPQINVNKHGFDASNGKRLLEIKNCSVGQPSLGGTWNDTTLEKACHFTEDYVSVALAAWTPDMILPLFVIYGSNSDIGEWLWERINNRKEGSRSTQSIDASALITKYGFKVYCAPANKKVVLETLHKYRKRTLGYLTEDDLFPFPGI